MGEMVDVTTVPIQENIFYKFTSGSLRFQVRGCTTAGIGLATTPYKYCGLWLILGRDGTTSVTRNGEQVHAVNTPNASLLTPHEFKEFWMQWHNDRIFLGAEYEENPIITYRHKTLDLKYVTFAVVGNEQHSLQWRFEMPPLLEKFKLKEVSSGIPQWVSAEGQLPDGALIGGYEKEILYIIRSTHRGSLTPGKFVPSHGLGYIPWGGQSHEKNELEVLCGYDCIWIPCSQGTVPAGSVEAGYSESSNHELLYVGRAKWDNYVIPGKIQPSHKVCYIPYNDREIAVEQFEILVVPHKNTQCGKQFCIQH